MFKGLYKYKATTYNTIRYCIYTLTKKFIAATDSGGPPWGLREQQNLTEGQFVRDKRTGDKFASRVNAL